MADEEYPNIWMRPERPTRGPRPAYSRAQITEAAVRIADAEGVEAATMRRIAAEIGAGAMSLYRYVPSRDDLIELMVDRIEGEQNLPARPTGDWRADLALLAEETRAMWLRHPWVATLQRARPAVGPNQLRIIEFAMGTLDVGLPIDEVLGLINILNGYIERTVRGELMWVEESRRSGIGESDWMARNGPYVRQLMASGDYPMFTRIVLDARQPHMDPEERFRYGLERVLDCIAVAVEAAPLPPEVAFTPQDGDSGERPAAGRPR
ncbi:TetR/AcrR family transcriptional regulator [Actinomadura rudentiformis]|uniref:TetR/AcrR family transcriptional regulator n=1 Tax=Actinomadura rudentiformis TaxID=359158 RepID=A0A6H9YPL0_9ACTN|nr:TetR/AcrR family transcriptional regulator [Actinomadura rudentiformis]KAB2349095.1 TetR/AcrR family transcriptional regulator [Actinomadura rudentiformis]